MPELPEVQALAEYLADRTVGRTIERVEVLSVQALKTFDPPVTALGGRRVADVLRHGKFLDLRTADGGSEEALHLVLHLARAGWIRYLPALPARAAGRPGRGPVAMRLLLDDGSGVQITERGSTKRLAAWVVPDPRQVPGVARLGDDPLSLGRDRLAALAQGSRARVKTLLTDQSLVAGVGNAYSDEILHTARLSPYTLARTLDGEQLDRLHAAITSVLGDAVRRARDLPSEELKAEKKAGLRVHGRAGERCPVCGDTIRSVVFSDSSLQYCPTCQTGGRVLADRRLSRLLK